MSVASAIQALEKGNEVGGIPVKESPKPTDINKEEVKTEGEVKPEGEAPKEEDIRAKRFAELSKKEQRILRKKLEMDKEMKDRENRLVEKEKEIKESVRQELRELAKKNPSAAIKELGTDYNSLTNHYLGDGKLTPETVAHSVDEKLAAMERRFEEQAKSFEAREKARGEEENRKILENFSATIVDKVKTSSDKYPAVAAFDGAPVIYEMIQKRWHDTGGKHLMTIEEAADILEKDLDSVISKVMQTPKYAARFSSSKKEEPKQTSLNKPKTITNELTSSAPSMLPAKTENDRIKRALEKLAT